MRTLDEIEKVLNVNGSVILEHSEFYDDISEELTHLIAIARAAEMSLPPKSIMLNNKLSNARKAGIFDKIVKS